jgi:hypothetical protein
MKTSLAAVVAAALFLVAALVGVGSGQQSPPAAPDTIVLAAPSPQDGATPQAAAPLVLPSPAAANSPGVPAVEGVGRAVQQTNLNELLAPSSKVSPSTGPATEALGLAPVPGPAESAFPLPAPASTDLSGGIAAPAPSPTPAKAGPHVSPAPQVLPSSLLGLILPSPRQILRPSPVPTPPVTATATPPVTATATPSP